ncbi:UNVERIFIED_ORG: hypothetical protein M2328_002763 [Rhodococcus erythropolis]
MLEHEVCDDRLVNEVFGFIMRCSAQSGAHLTDYVVSRGTAISMAGPSRVEILLAVSRFAGLLTDCSIDDRPAYKIVDTDPEFIHLRLKDEVEFERQRRRDNSNPALIIPVRLRDGDACRWCGKVVDWSVRKVGRSGTYDHLVPGEAATTDTYIVACVSCNSSRKDGERPRGITDLLPVPTAPYYSAKTVEFLEGNEWRKKNDLPVPPRPRKKIKPGDLAPGITTTSTAGVRPDNHSGNAATPTLDTATAARPVTPAPRTGTTSANATSNQRSGNHPETAEDRELPAQTIVPQNVRGIPTVSADVEGTEPVSTGRVGSGRVGSGRVGHLPHREVPADPDHPRKSSRGRRRRKPRNSQKRISGDTSE